MNSNTQTLAARIKDSSPSDQLRIAADLLELAKGESDRARALTLIKIASSIISPIATETGAMLALEMLKGKG